MAKTYEDQVGQELDALYQGALFLTAGDEQDAERLLVDTVAGAYRELERGGADPGPWFEARLARRSHDSNAVPASTPIRFAHIEPVPVLGPGDLHRAAAAVASWARAALWLVLLREWSYADAAAALEVSMETLRRMLDYRHVLVREMLRSDLPLRGAEGAVT